MKPYLTLYNRSELEWIGANGGTLDLTSFQIQVMLEFLIGDAREDEFNTYFNERVATLLKAARQQVTIGLLSQGNGHA